MKDGQIGKAEKWENFFKNMPSFRSFEESLDESNYQIVPEDWVVVLTDVKGSTKAIEGGRYHDVILIGAAGVTAIKNALGSDEVFPFAFGGDGVTAIVPLHKWNEVECELIGLRNLARKSYGLEIRVGMVTIRSLEAALTGCHVYVSKYELRNGFPLAVFRGDGLVRAEEMMKREGHFIIQEPKEGCGNHRETDLSSLFCFWSPIKSSRGIILSILIHAKTTINPDIVYRNVMAQLTEIMECGCLQNADPVNIEVMELFPMTALWYRAQQLFQNSKLALLHRLMVSSVMCLLCGTGFHKICTPLKNALSEFHSHSNFLGFNESLCMVLDCTNAESAAIEALCETFYLKDQIDYGIHRSTESLMTCYVPDSQSLSSLAFLDGGNGGYTMAAKALKERKKRSLSQA